MKFYMKSKHSAYYRSFRIRDEGQNSLFKIKGKFFITMRHLTMKDLNGQLLYQVNKKFDFSALKKYVVTNEQGVTVANITRTFGFKPTYKLTIDNQSILVEGNIKAHAFKLTQDEPLVMMKKGMFPFGEAVEIDIVTEKKPLLHLFLMIVLDQLAHEKRKFRR